MSHRNAVGVRRGTAGRTPEARPRLIRWCWHQDADAGPGHQRESFRSCRWAEECRERSRRAASA